MLNLILRIFGSLCVESIPKYYNLNVRRTLGRQQKIMSSINSNFNRNDSFALVFIALLAKSGYPT